MLHFKEFPRISRALLGKLSSSVADQATASTANFVMNVLLARWLSTNDYGAFSVAWSFCVLFAAFHNAVILEPMSVVGPAEYGSSLKPYLATVRKINWYVIAALACLAMLTGLFYREAPVKHALYALGLSLPGYLLLLSRRREQYIRNRPMKAFWMSAGYACMLATFLAICRWESWLSAQTGLVCIGAALPVALLAGRSRGSAGELTPVAQAHWKYGKWLFASAILAAGIADVQVILLSRLVDLQSAGALRALMNFVLPLSQLLTVLSVYSLPGLVRRIKASGTGDGLRQTLFFPMAMIAVALLYGAVMVVAGSWLEHLLYHGRMTHYVTYLPLLAAAAILSAVGASFSTLLRAAQDSRHQLIAGIIGTVVGIGAALLLLKPHGVGGAITSMILANGASSLWIVGTYIWKRDRE